MTSPWPHGDPRELIQVITADPRYRLPAPGRAEQPSWFDLVRDWVARFIQGILRRIDRALGEHNPFEAVIGFVVIAAALGLLGWAVFVLVRSVRRAAPRPSRRGVDGGAAEREIRAAELRARSRAAAGERRYRDAVALLFAAAVRDLDERGRLAYDPARTPGEYRRLVRDPIFDAFARDATVALFAAVEPRADVYERMDGTYDRFFDAPA